MTDSSLSQVNRLCHLSRLPFHNSDAKRRQTIRRITAVR